jgi:hypothetical protein
MHHPFLAGHPSGEKRKPLSALLALMTLLAIRLNEQTTLVKSLVMRALWLELRLWVNQ